MTFEEWMKRPVYVAQCYTSALAHRLGLGCHRFRALPGYRCDEASQARRLVAEYIRLERARRRGIALAKLDHQEVFCWAFTGPAGTIGGTHAAQDVRDSLMTALLAEVGPRKLFAELHAVPPEVIGELPGNRMPLFTVQGSWGRLTSLMAPAQA